jgi:transposase
MKAPIFVNNLTIEERQALEAGLRSGEAFSYRRCQILLASAQQQSASEIAKNLHCASQTVRNVIHAFIERGLDCLERGSPVPVSVQPVLTAEKRDQLQAIMHQSPRNFGKASSVWTLKLLAEVCQEQGLSETCLSAPTLLDAVVRLGSSWKRAKQWIVSPDPAYELKKKQRDRLVRLAESNPDIALGYQDEVWWSRAAQPQMHSWSQAEPLRLIQKQVPKKDPEGKAIAAYGLYLPAANQMLLRFVQGRPVSAFTCAFLAWLLAHFATQGKRALFLIWDNASWHISHEVRDWIKAHNRRVKQEGGCRLIVCRLPTKSPWLNPIEAKWVHDKRAVAEPARLLSMSELIQRVCTHYHCELSEPLSPLDC